jgi:hypothetical protein
MAATLIAPHPHTTQPDPNDILSTVSVTVTYYALLTHLLQLLLLLLLLSQLLQCILRILEVVLRVTRGLKTLTIATLTAIKSSFTIPAGSEATRQPLGR